MGAIRLRKRFANDMAAVDIIAIERRAAKA
jgi:hypothetical protein